MEVAIVPSATFRTMHEFHGGRDNINAKCNIQNRTIPVAQPIS
jgi:hypothetical protein